MVPSPARIYAYGPPKVGKTTFAAGFPGAFILQIEDGAEELDVARTPLLKTYDDVVDVMKYLIFEEHDHKTIVIDSVDWLEHRINEHICQEGGVDTISKYDGGYGAGFTRAAEMFNDVLRGLDRLAKERGCHVVLIAHAVLKARKDPLNESFDEWVPSVGKKINALCEEWSKLIGFAEYKTSVVKGKDGVRRGAKSKRILRVGVAGGHVGGNRYGLEGSLPLEADAVLGAIQDFYNNKGQ